MQKLPSNNHLTQYIKKQLSESKKCRTLKISEIICLLQNLICLLQNLSLTLKRHLQLNVYKMLNISCEPRYTRWCCCASPIEECKAPWEELPQLPFSCDCCVMQKLLNLIRNNQRFMQVIFKKLYFVIN